jgi:hypothetical protein
MTSSNGAVHDSLRADVPVAIFVVSIALIAWIVVSVW